MAEVISADLPCSRSDRFAKPADSVRTRDVGGYVYDTPRCRESNWGHRLEMDHPPPEHEVEGCFARWSDLHRGKGVERAYVTFETVQPWPGRTTVGMDCKLDPLTLMRFDGRRPEPVSTQAYEVRTFSDDQDWRAVQTLGWEVDPPQDEEAEKLQRYCDWYYGGLRARVERGEGAWWGIWSTSAADGVLLAAAGLFWKDEEARFQDVQTHPGYRRRGYCSALIHNAIRQRMRAHSGPVYIAATTESPIERLYLGLGFAPCSHAYALSVDSGRLGIADL